MTEADEVAGTMRTLWETRYPRARRDKWEGETPMNMARIFVRLHMKGESEAVIDNVAEALLKGD